MIRGKALRAVTSTLVSAVAVAALAGGTLVATAGVANAAGGLSELGESTYVVTDDGKPIKVTQKVTVTNRKASTSTTYFFWTGYTVWLPNGGSDLRATSNGSPLRTEVITRDGQQYADVSFPRELRYGQSRTFTLTYTIPGSPPRSEGSGRVGKGYAAIEVFSPGDAGSSTIEIRAPRWMALDSSEPATETQSGDTRISTISGGGPDGLWSRLSLRDSSQTLKKEVTVDDHVFNVVAFPGDTAWADHIAKSLPPTVRALEELTGQNWPTRTTHIYEDFSRLVYGWDGTYEGGNITVSEAIDPALLAHELAHAWAQGSNLEGRWLVEGLAQELATQVMATTKGKDQSRDTVRPTSKDAIPLLEWEGGVDGSATETEDYAYPASWQAVHALVAGSKAKARPELFKALTSRGTVYDAPGDSLSSAVGWEQAYDLFEITGGNTKTSSIMQTWVTGSSTKPQLTARTAARTAYAAHEKLDGEWSSTRGVRQAMAEWNFAAATTSMKDAEGLARAAAAAQAAAAKSGLDPKGARTAYERAGSADEYASVAKQLAAFTTEADTYAALRSKVDDANPIANLGALVLRPGDRLDEARSAFAEGKPRAATQALSTAETLSGLTFLTGLGILIAVPALIAGLAVLIGRGFRRRRTTDESPVAAGAVVGAPAATGAEEAPVDPVGPDAADGPTVAGEPSSGPTNAPPDVPSAGPSAATT